MKPLICAIAVLVADAASAFASSGAMEDNSDLLVWVFLAMCALIVVLQIAPSIMVMLGMAKGVSKKKEAKAAKH